MNVEVLARQFGRMGARVVIGANNRSDAVRMDVLKDKKGEYFEILAHNQDVELSVLDVRPKERHLLLMARFVYGRKDKFLCGHDERSWFVAAVPSEPGVANVPTAVEALKPALVRLSQAKLRVSKADLALRRNAAYIRQGEWFFLPMPNLVLDERWMLRNEPLRRDFRSKPHICEFVIRDGGEMVYVNPRGVSRQVLSAQRYTQLLRSKPGMASQGWQPMRRNPLVFAKGKVSHSDHKTIVLPFWHRVLMNTESEATAMQHVAFLD